MLNRVALAVDEHFSDVSELRDTVIGGLGRGDLYSVTNLESGSLVTIDIKGLRTIGNDSALGCQSNDNS